MSCAEEDFLQISGIEHFVFCRRQWALIHLEQQWDENERTAQGRILHENAHDAEFFEQRGDIVTVRGMRVFSAAYGISGECDVVEFHKDSAGIFLQGLAGKYTVMPVEYKKGAPKESDCDCLQLCAQAICLEEMLVCEIPRGCLFYGETRRRQNVTLDKDLREKTIEMIGEMRKLYERRHTPKVRRTKSCGACSLRDICLPGLSKQAVADYIREMTDS